MNCKAVVRLEEKEFYKQIFEASICIMSLVIL
jgi:hypothetical protein